MAEALARALFDSDVQVQSAGSRPTRMNPWAVEVLAEAGIASEGQRSKSMDEVDREGVDTVVTLCSDEACPLWIGPVERLHWPIADPATEEELPREEMLARFRATREEIRGRLEGLLREARG
jgi:arsenate reductase